MAVQASKLISLTVVANSGALKLSANKIVKFTASGSDTLLTYITNGGRVITKLVDETVGTINTAAARTQAVTLDSDGSTVYIHSDKIIYMYSVTAGTAIVLQNPGFSCGFETLVVTEAVADINTAAGNTLAVTRREDGVVVYINNLFIDSVNAEYVKLPQFNITYKIKVETVAPSAGGAGYTAATVAFAGGGSGATLPTATATVAAGAVTGIVIATAGSNITEDVTCTISGDGTGALAVNVIHHIVDTITIADAGSDLNTAPTITFAAGTVTATATTTISAVTGMVTGTTITNVGSYLASAFPPAVTIAGGGAGAEIMYDAKKTGYDKIVVEETAAAIQTAVNAL